MLTCVLSQYSDDMVLQGEGFFEACNCLKGSKHLWMYIYYLFSESHHHSFYCLWSYERGNGAELLDFWLKVSHNCYSNKSPLKQKFLYFSSETLSLYTTVFIPDRSITCWFGWWQEVSFNIVASKRRSCWCSADTGAAC